MVAESIEMWLEEAPARVGIVSTALWLPYEAVSQLLHALEEEGHLPEVERLQAALWALRAHEAQ
jgi:hypothetical protein